MIYNSKYGFSRQELEAKACQLYKQVYHKSSPTQFLSSYNENFENGWKPLADQILYQENLVANLQQAIKEKVTK